MIYFPEVMFYYPKVILSNPEVDVLLPVSLCFITRKSMFYYPEIDVVPPGS